jgi:hypothetical protein
MEPCGGRQLEADATGIRDLANERAGGFEQTIDVPDGANWIQAVLERLDHHGHIESSGRTRLRQSLGRAGHHLHAARGRGRPSASARLDAQNVVPELVQVAEQFP